MVGGLCAKLGAGEARATRADEVGGSTWTFDVWPDRPMEPEVRALLRRVRADVTALRARVTAHNESQSPPAGGASRVVFYAGQNVLEDDRGDDQEDQTGGGGAMERAASSHLLEETE